MKIITLNLSKDQLEQIEVLTSIFKSRSAIVRAAIYDYVLKRGKKE